MSPRLLRRCAVPFSVLLLATLAACQDEPTEVSPAYVGAVATPRLELVWFPDEPEPTGRLTVGDQQYVDPCALFPPEAATELFELGTDASVVQLFLAEPTEASGFGTWFFCSYLGPSRAVAGVWTAHHDSAKEATSSVRQPGARRVTGTDLWRRALTVGEGRDARRRLVVSKTYGRVQVDVDVTLARSGPDVRADALRRARQSFQRIDEAMDAVASLPQAPLPPTLGADEAVGEAVIVPGCELLSSRIVEHLSGGLTPHDARTQTVLPADLTRPARSDGRDRAHRGGCFWDASSDPRQTGEAGVEVHLQIGYAGSTREAAGELAALLRAHDIDPDTLAPLEGVEAVDDGGYALTGDGISMWAFRSGPYAGALSLTNLHGTSQDHDPRRGLEPLAAILQRLDRLAAERAAD